ncbi:hypothetical protein 10P302A_gene0025 [Pseudomonas phage 10P302A]|uniref:Uncharacterized protein n=1 Tax=Pseudomonas phage 10P302A TaxID=3038233 RepID=A0AAF0K2E1_9CAUD|nr:hypothetical protein 10P302A_gene0025 [Pseudomonas phage 10P302A]
MRKFDLVTFLITLAGRLQEKRHAKLVAREESLKAAITAAQNALQTTVQSRVEAKWKHDDIKRVS